MNYKRKNETIRKNQKQIIEIKITTNKPKKRKDFFF